MLEAGGFNVRVEGYNVLVEVREGDYGALLELLTIASRNGVFLMNVDFMGATLEELLSSGDST